jgi:hypothetical protein
MDVKLPTHLQLVPRQRKLGSIHPSSHTSSWRSNVAGCHSILAVEKHYNERPERVLLADERVAAIRSVGESKPVFPQDIINTEGNVL